MVQLGWSYKVEDCFRTIALIDFIGMSVAKTSCFILCLGWCLSLIVNHQQKFRHFRAEGIWFRIRRRKMLRLYGEMVLAFLLKTVAGWGLAFSLHLSLIVIDIAKFVTRETK